MCRELKQGDAAGASHFSYLALWGPTEVEGVSEEGEG